VKESFTEEACLWNLIDYRFSGKQRKETGWPEDILGKFYGWTFLIID
jgi:hypothetical protein